MDQSLIELAGEHPDAFKIIIESGTQTHPLPTMSHEVIEALVVGKALRIEGGSYILREGAGQFRCGRCGDSFPSRTGRKGRGWRCPTCDSSE